MLKKDCPLKSKMFNVHVNLMVIYIELNREEQAKAAMAEALRLSPQWSLETWRQNVPFKNPAEIERFAAALRKAGLK